MLIASASESSECFGWPTEQLSIEQPASTLANGVRDFLLVRRIYLPVYGVPAALTPGVANEPALWRLDSVNAL